MAFRTSLMIEPFRVTTKTMIRLIMSSSNYNRAMYRTYDYNPYFTEHQQGLRFAAKQGKREWKGQLKGKKMLGWVRAGFLAILCGIVVLSKPILFFVFVLACISQRFIKQYHFLLWKFVISISQMTTHIRSLRHVPSLKIQKEIKEEHQKEEFFQRLMEVIDEELTLEEHEFLLHFVIQNRRRTANNHCEQNRAKDSNTNEECPLAAIKDNLFREIRKQKVREMLMTEEMQEKPSPMPTARNLRINRKHHMATVFLQKQNQEQFAFNRSCTKNDRLFKIYPIKRSKKTAGNTFQNLLNNQSLKSYNNQFLTSLLDSDISQDQFSDNSLLQPQIPTPNIFQPHHRQDQKYSCLHQIKFERPLRRNRTALKLHSRKF